MAPVHQLPPRNVAGFNHAVSQSAALPINSTSGGRPVNTPVADRAAEQFARLVPSIGHRVERIHPIGE